MTNTNNKRAGVRWSLESNSWWYPGHTVRIIVQPSSIGVLP